MPKKAQIAGEGAPHLYREIRVENTLHDENGEKVALKRRADVEVSPSKRTKRHGSPQLVPNVPLIRSPISQKALDKTEV